MWSLQRRELVESDKDSYWGSANNIYTYLVLFLDEFLRCIVIKRVKGICVYMHIYVGGVYVRWSLRTNCAEILQTLSTYLYSEAVHLTEVWGSWVCLGWLVSERQIVNSKGAMKVFFWLSYTPCSKDFFFFWNGNSQAYTETTFLSNTNLIWAKY